MAGHGGEIENVSSVFREEGQGELAAKAESLDVDSPHFFPLCGIAISEAGEVGKSGGIDEDVELVERGEGFADLLGIAEVTSQRSDSFGKIFDRATKSDDLHAFFLKRERDGFSDAG